MTGSSTSSLSRSDPFQQPECGSRRRKRSDTLLSSLQRRPTWRAYSSRIDRQRSLQRGRPFLLPNHRHLLPGPRSNRCLAMTRLRPSMGPRIQAFRWILPNNAMKLRHLLYAFRALCRKAYRLALRKPLLVNPWEQSGRLSKCSQCPHFHRGRAINPMEDRCGICGCFLSLKTMFVDEVCPDKENPQW